MSKSTNFLESFEKISSEYSNYWECLSQQEYTESLRVLKCGPLLHHENRLEHKHLYIRDCYHTFYDIVNKTKSNQVDEGMTIRIRPDSGLVWEEETIDRENEEDPQQELIVSQEENDISYRHVFFAGTSGVGTSCFRTYMMWRQIQVLKHKSKTGVIWATKSLSGTSPDQVLLIENGETIRHLSLTGQEKVATLLTYFEALKIPVYVHIDVSASAGNTGPILGTVNYYYTSPNVEVWKEKLKIHSILRFLPNWENEELLDFYCHMGINHIFLQKLGIEGLPENVKGLIERVNGDSISIRLSPLKKLLHVRKEAVQILIAEEAQQYGPIPRNMFLGSDEFIAYKQRLRSAVANLDATANHHPFSENALHALYLLIPDEKYVICKFKWLGNFVVTEVVKCQLERLDQQIAINFLQGQGYSLFRDDLKLKEILIIGCFAVQPNYFRFNEVPRKNEQHMLSSPVAIDGLKIMFANGANHCNIKCITNQQMLQLASDMNWRGVVSPLNSQHHNIDGIARFTYEGVLYTAFLQVTESDSYELRTDNIDMLKHLHDIVTSAATAHHKIVVLSIKMGQTLKSAKCFYSSFSNMFSPHMDEYVLTKAIVDMKVGKRKSFEIM